MDKLIQHKRQLFVIVMVVFLGFVGISMPYLIFPSLFLNPGYAILSEETHESLRALLLGITLAAYPFGQFIGAPILGSLSDDYGRKRILSWSLLIAAACNLITGLAIEWRQLGVLILGRFAAGTMEGNIAVARAMAVEIKTLSKHETLGKINAASSIAFLIGPLIGGVMADKSLWGGLTPSLPFYCICLLFLSLAGLSALVFESSASSPATERRSFAERIHVVKRVASLCSNKRLQFLLVTSTAFTLAVDIFYEFGPVYLTGKWLVGPFELIFYNATVCIALTVGNGWLPSFCGSRVSSRWAIISATALFALALVIMPLVEAVVPMLLLFFLSGLAIGLAVTLLTVQISDSVSDEIQGEVMGVQLSLRVLGDAVICLLGSVLLILSPALILCMAATVCLISTVYYASEVYPYQVDI